MVYSTMVRQDADGVVEFGEFKKLWLHLGGGHNEEHNAASSGFNLVGRSMHPAANQPPPNHLPTDLQPTPNRLSIISQPAPNGQESLEIYPTFQKYDLNKKGYLSQYEVKKMMVALGYKVRRQDTIVPA